MSLTLRQFKSMLREEAKRVGGIRALARLLDVNHGHLARTLKHDNIDPIPSIVNAAGYRKLDRTVYERI